MLAIVRLLFCVLRTSGVRMDRDRVPSGEGKNKLLGAIAFAGTATFRSGRSRSARNDWGECSSRSAPG